MVALSIEDVALIKRCEIIAAVRFRGGATGVIKRGVTFHEYGNVFRPGRGERRLAEDQGTQKMPGGKPLRKISLVVLQDFSWNVLLSICNSNIEAPSTIDKDAHSRVAAPFIEKSTLD